MCALDKPQESRIGLGTASTSEYYTALQTSKHHLKADECVALNGTERCHLAILASQSYS